MKTLKFARNYNGKLDQEIFTTIRKFENGGKYDFEGFPTFKLSLGSHPQNGLGAPYGMAIAIGRKRYPKLKNVPMHTLRQDTGLETSDEIFKLFAQFGIFRESPVIVLTLKRSSE